MVLTSTTPSLPHQVMVWTEFFLFTLFATFEYSFESADLSVASRFFDTLALKYSCGQVGMQDCTVPPYSSGAPPLCAEI